MPTTCRAILIALSTLTLGACAQGLGSQGGDAPGQITTGSIDRKPEKALDTEARVQSVTGAGLTFAAAGTPADVYVTIAKGAMGCWFSPAGPLRRSHVFSADVDPPAKGGAALITIHEKDAGAPDQRGARAFQVAMTTAPGGTQVAIATPKMAPEIAQAMKQDVQIWANGKQSCEVATLLAPTPTALAKPPTGQPARQTTSQPKASPQTPR